MGGGLILILSHFLSLVIKSCYFDNFFKEFLLAIDVTSNGCPEEKLNWAFRFLYLIFSSSKLNYISFKY